MREDHEILWAADYAREALTVENMPATAVAMELMLVISARVMSVSINAYSTRSWPSSSPAKPLNFTNSDRNPWRIVASFR